MQSIKNQNIMNKELTPMQELIQKNRKSIKLLQEIKNKTEFERGMLAYAHAIETDIIILSGQSEELIKFLNEL